jgi:hypothetical protein
MEEIKILGFTLQQWVESMDSNDAENVEKALCYYDGDQEEAMEKLLSDNQRGRKNWRERGIIPRFRNLTNMIVEKSGKLFKDNPPVITAETESLTHALMSELEAANYIEFFQNLDSTVRLVKTALVLVQYDSTDNTLAFELLHRANSSIMLDQSMKHIQALVYKTSEMDNIETYRIITIDEYIDLIETEDEYTNVKRVAITNREPNPYGIIPVTFFHDTKIPRNGFWNKPGMDLISINELYNLHLTDSEYAISWAKLPTLFTNCEFAETEDSLEESVPYGSKYPHLTQAAPEIIGGPSRAIQLNSQGVDSPFIEYKSPKIDIKPLDETIGGWIQQYAYDWSVNLVTGNGTANSGFQLVVEEIPNLELRQQRSKQMAAGIKRLYSIISTVLNTARGNNIFTGSITVEFTQPKLPVDIKQNQEAWDLKIAGNRASVIDYLVEEEGYTRDEAINKYNEIKLFNQQ